MTCMDCVHYELCRDSGLLMNDLMKTKQFRVNLEKNCPFKKFKNKTGKWVSVPKKLPTASQNCLVFYKHSYAEDDYWAIGIASYVDEIQEFVGIDTRHYVITHWMPLPEPPKSQ